MIFFSISFGSILKLTGSISVSTGVAFIRETTPAVAKKEKVGTITSSPGFISIAISASKRASVPEETPLAYLQPRNSQNSFSIFCTSGPRIKYCDSATRNMALSSSDFNARYCSFRSNNGTFITLR